MPRGAWWVWWLQVPSRSRGNRVYGPGLSARSWGFWVPFSLLLEMYWEEATSFSHFQVRTLVANKTENYLLEAIRRNETTGPQLRPVWHQPDVLWCLHTQRHVQTQTQLHTPRHIYEDMYTHKSMYSQTYTHIQCHSHAEICIGAETCTHRHITHNYIETHSDSYRHIQK